MNALTTPPVSEHFFLFPHQDDETPVLLAIERLVREGQPVRIVYLTTGQPNGEACEVRNAESLHVLASLGIAASQVWFLGAEIGIPDGHLQKHLDPAWQALNRALNNAKPASFHMPAWEGGHQDHDAAHMLGVMLSKQWDCMEQSFQFPYYHGHRLKGILFKTLDPLALNGPPVSEAIPFWNRLKYLRLLMTYRSQLKTWIGLGPFFALHYLLRGTQIRQHITVARIHEKPHEGAMLYERRAFGSYELFLEDTRTFKTKYLL